MNRFSKSPELTGRLLRQRAALDNHHSTMLAEERTIYFGALRGYASASSTILGDRDSRAGCHALCFPFSIVAFGCRLRAARSCR